MPTTLIASRIVGTPREDAFRAWADEIAAAAQDQPGFVGGLRIAQTGGVYHLVYRFRDEASLATWEASPAYRDLQRRAAYAVPGRTVVAGTMPWVRLPGEADGPAWKRFVMTWVAALPVALAINALLGLLPRPLPGPVQAIVTSFVLVAAMTFVILPLVSRRLKPWVMKDGDGQASVES